MYEVINSDLFDIVWRLKAIDEDYFVVYNRKLKRFEVHNRAQRGSTLAVALPYDRLDCRTLHRVYKTRFERREQLIKEIERDNERREKECFRSSIDKAMAEARL